MKSLASEMMIGSKKCERDHMDQETAVHAGQQRSLDRMILFIENLKCDKD